MIDRDNCSTGGGASRNRYVQRSVKLDEISPLSFALTITSVGYFVGDPLRRTPAEIAADFHDSFATQWLQVATCVVLAARVESHEARVLLICAMRDHSD